MRIISSREIASLELAIGMNGFSRLALRSLSSADARNPPVAKARAKLEDLLRIDRSSADPGNLIGPWVLISQSDLEERRQPTTESFNVDARQLATKMACAELRSNANVCDVTKPGPFRLLARKAQYFADRAPIAVPVLQIGVGQGSIDIEHD
jgi:hypothetical protein